MNSVEKIFAGWAGCWASVLFGCQLGKSLPDVILWIAAMTLTGFFFFVLTDAICSAIREKKGGDE